MEEECEGEWGVFGQRFNEDPSKRVVPSVGCETEEGVEGACPPSVNERLYIEIRVTGLQDVSTSDPE